MKFHSVVYKDHTLGLLGSINTAPTVENNFYSSFWVQPLRASILKGATFSVRDCAFIACPQDLRFANRQDFDDYRVKWHPDYLVVPATDWYTAFYWLDGQKIPLSVTGKSMGDCCDWIKKQTNRGCGVFSNE